MTKLKSKLLLMGAACLAACSLVMAQPEEAQAANRISITHDAMVKSKSTAMQKKSKKTVNFTAWSGKNNVTAKASWKSSKPDVASIKAGKATLKKTGTVKITAAYKGASKSVTLKVTKNSPKITTKDKGLSVTSNAAKKNGSTLSSPLSNKTVQFTARWDGKNISNKASWKSSNTKAATITKSGKALLKANGTTKITCKYKNKSKTVTLKVTGKPDTQAGKDASYTVNYTLKNGTKLAASKTVSKMASGRIVMESAKYIPGYTPDETTKAIQLKKGKNIINFIYKPRTDILYTVKYVDAAGRDIYQMKTVKNRTTGEVVTETCPDIKGWTPDAKAKSLTLKASGNVITFTYTQDKKIPAEITVKYYVNKNGYKEIADRKVINNYYVGDKVAVKPVAVPGYNPTLSHQDVEVTDTKINVSFVYEPKKDITYTVDYLDAETGKKIQGNKTVTDQTMDAVITEYAPAIKGYVTPKKQELTLKASDNKIVFKYEKTPDSDTDTKPVKPVCEHNWKDIYKTETYTETIEKPCQVTVQTGTKHHDAVTEQRWVSRLKTKTMQFCICGQTFNDKTELENHIMELEILGSAMGIDTGSHKFDKTDTIEVDNGYYEEVTIKGAYDEPIYETVTRYEKETVVKTKEVLDHTECSKCGVRKN